VSGAEASELLKRVAEQMWAEQQRHRPQDSTSAGTRLYDGRLNDLSPAKAQRYAQTISRLGETLAQIDRESLSDRDLLIFDGLSKQVADTSSRQEEQFALWNPASSQNGTLVALEELFVVNHTLDTPKDVATLIKRFEQVGRQLEQAQNNIRRGISLGYTPSQAVIDATIAEAKSALPQKIEDSPLLGVLSSFSDTISADEQARAKAEILAAFDRHVKPAVENHAVFLKTLKGIEDPPGLIGMPNGKGREIYQREIAINTDTTMTAAQLHQLGKKHVAAAEQQMRELAEKLLPETSGKPLAEMVVAVKALAKEKPLTPEETQRVVDAAVADAERDLSALWGVTVAENTPVEVKIVSFGSMAFYGWGTLDGKRSGTLFINGSLDLTPFELRTKVYHEYTHHLQDLVASRSDLPPGVRFSISNATTEGHGLYSEHLAREEGLLTSDFDVFGSLSDDMLRNVRLVVDTGLHDLGWSRQDAIDYMLAHTTMSAKTAESEVDRYISLPAQALGYKVGQLECVRLRDEAKEQLGDKFDLAEFNRVLLMGQAAPLSTSSVLVQRYIARKKADALHA
jgi:uncharacterized protein (DUF885 family)